MEENSYTGLRRVLGGDSQDWFREYAERALSFKKLPKPTQTDVKTATDVVRRAFFRIYRAVAFDIDGTLTLQDSAEIDHRMADIVAELLKRGVLVLLISGRGRGACRAAATAIREKIKLTGWYYRRLQCVAHNGVVILKSDWDRPQHFMASEKWIGKPIPQVRDLMEILEVKLEEAGLAGKIKLSLEPSSASAPPHSIRIEVLDATLSRQDVRSILNDFILGLSAEDSTPFITEGRYGDRLTFDVSSVTKSRALALYASEIGVAPEQILRIGDQGQEGGNDFDLLDSESGFSVKHLSNGISTCHPVLSQDLTRQLEGAEATNVLLANLLICPPFSISPNPPSKIISTLRSFEKLALIKSRENEINATEKMRSRIHALLGDAVDDEVPLEVLQIADIYDAFSGGIKFRDWELEDVVHSHPGRELFRIPSFIGYGLAEPPRYSRFMLTDTGILLRGPDYYFFMTNDACRDGALESYEEMVNVFSGDSIETLDRLIKERPTFLSFKFVLSILDNIRNILLVLQYAVFRSEVDLHQADSEVSRRFFLSALLPHTEIHSRFLMDDRSKWVDLIRDYRDFLIALRTTLTECFTFLKRACPSIEATARRKVLRDWRESDHFLQNMVALSIGLSQFLDHGHLSLQDKLVLVGLVYGGTELPAISLLLCKNKGIQAIPSFMGVSHYGNLEIGKLIREGKHEYIAQHLAKSNPPVLLHPEGSKSRLEDSKTLILDDNCTTCITLQMARDILVWSGTDVLGAIAIRFPSANRQVQMAMNGHGFPDPDILFAFIRGLVAPSPYTRLIFQAKGSKPMLDQSGVFDKAKARIQNYLFKNGTPAIEAL